MSWLEALHFLPKAPDPRPAREIEGDILAELQFHLDMKTRDLEAAGMNPEQAREMAQEKFGNLDRVFQRCRRAQLGERIMMQRLLFVMMILLIGAVAFLGVQAHEASQSNRQTAQALDRIDKRLEKIGGVGVAEASTSSVSATDAAVATIVQTLHDVTGQVLDEQGKPVSGADVLLIMKTWPPGVGYRQTDHATKTDASGHFRFPAAGPLDSAFNLSVLAEGFALRSVYEEKDRDAAKFQPKTITLLRGEKRVLRLNRTRSNKGHEKLWVYPAERWDQKGNSHVVYSQGSARVWKLAKMDESNWDGEIEVSWFLPGEKGQIGVGDGKEVWATYMVSPDDSEVIIND